ncbi:T9SS type A sorting domain-containing protein [Polaribacter staleyi]|uniref:T9SS type A sorting domain-containing protein n=1 Tax=Polaribacter staleyi TaxID=2022337 RepID=UPI0031BB43F4
MMIKTPFFILFFVINFQCFYAQIDNEANFYTSVANANFNKNLVSDYNVDNDFTTDDSSKLEDAINDISSNGGGILTIPAGDYSFGDINLKSNVHIEVHPNVVIRPFYEIPSNGKLKNSAIFNLGDNTSPIKNVSIKSSTGNRFTVDLTHNNNPNIAVVSCGKVSNFVVANFNVLDSFTKFSAVTFGGDFYNEEYTFPENGIVKDIDIQNAHYGYGVVQTQSAENILFKDLSGTGGATLRLETGFTGLNDLQGTNLPSGVKRVGGIDKIVARNISCTNGNSALMISPHALHNGTVDAEGIHSISAGFAVRVEGGFISNKYDQTIGLTKGTFEFVRVKNVTATYGENAEIKAKHFHLYPQEITPPTTLASYISEDETEVYVGAAIAPVLADTNYTCTNGVKTVVVEEPVVGTGFEYQEDIIPAEYLTINCAALSVDDNKTGENAVKIVPNPSTGFINLKNINNFKKATIYNISGQWVKTINGNDSSRNVDVRILKPGVYFVKINADIASFTRKLIIQ